MESLVKLAKGKEKKEESSSKGDLRRAAVGSVVGSGIGAGAGYALAPKGKKAKSALIGAGIGGVHGAVSGGLRRVSDQYAQGRAERTAARRKYWNERMYGEKAASLVGTASEKIATSKSKEEKGESKLGRNLAVAGGGTAALGAGLYGLHGLGKRLEGGKGSHLSFVGSGAKGLGRTIAHPVQAASAYNMSGGYRARKKGMKAAMKAMGGKM